MRAAEWKTKALPSLLGGTERMPLKLADPNAQQLDVLATLSLTGQALRFTRPIGPDHFAVEPKIIDERKILPEPLRKPLIWLLRGRRMTEDVEFALAWSFARLKLRPHPFDLPRMPGFVRAHASELGLTAQHWARRDTTVSDSLPRAEDELDVTNWQTANSSARMQFLATQRRRDPAQGLDLVRAVWAGEDAEMRLRLLETLQPELHDGDREFITAAGKDRGARVRSLAQRMAYRLNGFQGEHPALRECLTRITQKTKGLLRNRVALALEVPATIKEHTLKGWIRETFAEVRCDELAQALGLQEKELIEASEKDANLLLALALMSTADHRLDLLEDVVKRLPEAWEQMTQCGPMRLERTTPEERMSWAHCLVSPYGDAPPISFGAWSWMHGALHGPLPVKCVKGALRSKAWRDQLNEAKGPAWAELLAACCPAQLRQRLSELLGSIEPAHTASALALLDILNAMERG